MTNFSSLDILKMRAWWFAKCTWLEKSEIESMSDSEIIGAVSIHFEGGISDFICAKIIIRQVKSGACDVCLGGVIYSGGRVQCKDFAKDLHNKTGFPIYNIKKGGIEVLVTPAK